MWELDYKESWALKNWCFWTVVLEKTLESPLNCKEIQPVHPKGNQSWIVVGRTDAEAEAPIIWTPDVKNWLIGKDHDASKDWRQEDKGMTEDEMVGWHHWLDGHGFEQAQGVGDGREAWRVAVHGIAKSWPQLSYWTELNWTEYCQAWREGACGPDRRECGCLVKGCCWMIRLGILGLRRRRIQSGARDKAGLLRAFV